MVHPAIATNDEYAATSLRRGRRGGSGVASVPQTAGAEAALRSEAQTSDRRLRSQIGGWDLRSEAEPWGGGGSQGGPKVLKVRKGWENQIHSTNIIITSQPLTQLQPQARSWGRKVKKMLKVQLFGDFRLSTPRGR